MSHPALALPVERIAEVCRRYSVRELSLFGSALRSDFSPESDVDLLVEFQPGASIGFLELLRMQGELADLLERPVDLVSKRGLRPPIRDEVLQEREIIYAS